MPVTVALCQHRVKSAHLSDNLKSIQRSVEVLKTHGTQKSILICPELCVSGYLLGDQWERPRFLKQVLQAQKELGAMATGGLAIVAGILGVDWERTHEDGRPRLFNCGGVAFQGQWLLNSALGMPWWPKTLLPNYRLFDDARHFYDLRKLAQEQGKSLEHLISLPQIPWDTPFSLLLGVCEDGWVKNYPLNVNPYFEGLKNPIKPHLVVNLSCSPYSPQKYEKRKEIFHQLAFQLGSPLAYANAVGVQNSGKTIHVFDGCSQVFDPRKETPVAPSLPLAEALRIFHWEGGKDSSPSLVFREDVPLSPGPKAWSLEWPRDTFGQKTAVLKQALEWQCQEWQVGGVVVGVSGGVDSAVVATLFHHILGPEQMILVYMPSKHSSPITRNAAVQLAHNLKRPLNIWSIQPAVEQTIQGLERCLGRTPSALRPSVLENIQARDRGSRLLASLAASRGYVFSCNSNKSELTVGYGTFYGDIAGFLAPIADLWKGEVYGVARCLNAQCGAPLIPDLTLTLPPSAELGRIHRVERGLGDPLHYPYHDALFKSWVEPLQRLTYEDNLEAFQQGSLEEQIGCRPGLTQLLFPSYESFLQDLTHWWARYEKLGVAKRVQAPPIVALSKRSFGSDLREYLPHF